MGLGLHLVECVPNFSEGRRKDVIEAIAGAVRSVAGVTLLDVESNTDHNRSVISFVGDPGQVKEAALAASRKAVELIDLNLHRGEHPRMGAVDVVPFIPLSGTTMEECVRLAREFGKEFGDQLQVPVFLYEEAATTPERRNLADVRAGEFEGLRDQMGKRPDKRPDFGPEKIHPTAGATAVGAREILIAYNVNLGTGNVEVAKKIAHQLRSKDGGLSYVKALGFELKKQGMVQVSMNLTNYKRSQLFKAYELVRLFADRYGVPVVESEIVGLTPMDALVDAAQFYLKLENFSRDQILENRLSRPSQSSLTDMSLTGFSEEVASKKPTPGGGSVSAYLGALGASLLTMVSRISLGKKEVADGERLEVAVKKGEELRSKLLELVIEDAKAFDQVMQAYRIPKEQQESRLKAIRDATAKAAEVPLETLDNSVQVLLLARDLAETGWTGTLSDVKTAVAAAKAAAEGAASNVNTNLDTIQDEGYVEKISIRVSRLNNETHRLEMGIRKILEARSKKTIQS